MMKIQIPTYQDVCDRAHKLNLQEFDVRVVRVVNPLINRKGVSYRSITSEVTETGFIIDTKDYFRKPRGSDFCLGDARFNWFLHGREVEGSPKYRYDVVTRNRDVRFGKEQN